MTDEYYQGNDFSITEKMSDEYFYHPNLLTQAFRYKAEF